MLTPKRARAIDFLLERERWIRGHIDNGCCRACGSAIEFVQAFMSIHDARFEGCVGPGQVVRVAIPFCSFCEDKAPDEQGCFHEESDTSSVLRREGLPKVIKFDNSILKE